MSEWKSSEIAILKRMHGRRAARDIAHLLGRSPQSVSAQASRIGITSGGCTKRKSKPLSAADREKRAVTVERFVKHCGSLSAAARALGINEGTACKWRQRQRPVSDWHHESMVKALEADSAGNV